MSKKKTKPKSRKGVGGRPRVVTWELVQEIAEDIGYGMTEEQACAAAEVNPKSLETARRRNPEFEGAIKKGQAMFLRRALRAIADGGTWDAESESYRPWTGLAWILERRHKPQFSRLEARVGLGSAGGLLMTADEEAELQRLAFEMFGKKGAKC